MNVSFEDIACILSPLGFISSDDGGKELCDLYLQRTQQLNQNELSTFGKMCYTGCLDGITKILESEDIPHLDAAETPLKLGYATLIVLGAQRISRIAPKQPKKKIAKVSPFKHIESLSHLISMGLDVDVPSIAGFTALHHAVTATNKCDEPELELARILVTEGQANVNYQDQFGKVPLFGAVKRNHVSAVELLMQSGADLYIPDADGCSPDGWYMGYGPQVTAVITKWMDRRKGVVLPRAEKQCDNCARRDATLKNCAECQVFRYCSGECQAEHWPMHKLTCKPFTPENSVTVKPSYGFESLPFGQMMSTANLIRGATGVPAIPQTAAQQRVANIPKNLTPSKPKSIVIKVQPPFTSGAPSSMPMLVYTKKRDLTCYIIKRDNPRQYEQLAKVIREKGVGGAKGYFVAILKSKDELVIRTSDVLAAQPF
ncbi:hypothetical protein AMATHDRAFT_68629 [Amanita thiersii Skay4041]|uniref:MYND-type domain-containing protein n=1 Tax=Amanita thiersii Skay4041 TaxID=703135 RepID=A0A2A9N8B9_9AGAR|nr:hypothetical protein AMATHDRAFT_68629 [Amanita thiersii Skay4041]